MRLSDSRLLHALLRTIDIKVLGSAGNRESSGFCRSRWGYVQAEQVTDSEVDVGLKGRNRKIKEERGEEVQVIFGFLTP
jgi:hypothetical protein